MRRVPKLRWLLAVLLAIPLLYIGSLLAADPLLTIRTPLMPVDVIVVLGGDGPVRAAKAAEVYDAIRDSAPDVLISGDGDCFSIAEQMVARGVPAESFTIECASGTTWENAKYSAPLLRAMQANSALLVTSGFHLRRAIACFEEFSPQIRWGGVPADGRHSVWKVATHADGIQTAKEFLKVPWYAVRYFLPARLGLS